MEPAHTYGHIFRCQQHRVPGIIFAIIEFRTARESPRSPKEPPAQFKVTLPCLVACGFDDSHDPTDWRRLVNFARLGFIEGKDRTSLLPADIHDDLD